jgi:hypothetical protein
VAELGRELGLAARRPAPPDSLTRRQEPIGATPRRDLGRRSCTGDGRGRRERSAGQEYAHFRRAFELKPDHPDVARELMRACLGLGRGDEAVMAARQACSSRPDDAGLLANLGLVLLVAGDVEEASVVTQWALALGPEGEITRALLRGIQDVKEDRATRPTHWPDDSCPPPERSAGRPFPAPHPASTEEVLHFPKLSSAARPRRGESGRRRLMHLHHFVKLPLDSLPGFPYHLPLAGMSRRCMYRSR